jgi:ABC-2 type transport system ATP-binding protein
VQITAKNLAIGYDQPLSSNLNFEIKTGEIVGLVGANGSGKTTLIRTLLGLNSPLAGLANWDPSLGNLRATGQIGVVWQDAGLPFSVSPLRWINQIAKLHDKPVNSELLDILEVPMNRRPIRNLSGGEKQRLAIYSALFHNPQVLILDEPTVGLDEMSRNHFYELMHQFRSRGGLALLTSHYAMDINSICDRVISLSASSETGFGFFSCIPNLSAEQIVKFGLTELSNGYQINLPDAWAQAVQIQQETGAKIQNFQVLRNA